MDISRAAESSIQGEFRKKIWAKLVKAISDYQLIQDGDRICVCISGGKDSVLMAKCLQMLQRFGKPSFTCEYIVMDPGYAPKNRQKIQENTQKLGIPARFFDTKIFSSVETQAKHPCFLCAKLRRGWLYKTAGELGCNKIALGHHFDDVIETILMGMLYGSQMQTMMPKLHSENYPGMELIRPLYLIREEDVIGWAKANGLDFIQCACSVSENRESGSKRAKVKALLRELRRTDPAVDMNIFRSAENVNLQTLISYHLGEERHHFLDSYDQGLSIRGTKNQ
ncbi:MAG: tRNA 2-thiocytidine biosynthesis protein TtcA [Ruminococcus sp.]|nr:tRNA 2-thiocytidine biosynthesis protein TtcA [Ruminococcus sp.]